MVEDANEWFKIGCTIDKPKRNHSEVVLNDYAPGRGSVFTTSGPWNYVVAVESIDKDLIPHLVSVASYGVGESI